MRLRDLHATLSSDTTEYVMPSGGIQIIADDGRSLFDIRLSKEGHIEVSSGHFCKHAGKVLDDYMRIEPRACNLIYIHRNEYKEKKGT